MLTSMQELRLAGEFVRDSAARVADRSTQAIVGQLVLIELAPGQFVSDTDSVPIGVYVLDLDYYDEGPRRFEREEHLEQLKRFNNEIWELFRWCLTEN